MQLIKIYNPFKRTERQTEIIKYNQQSLEDICRNFFIDAKIKYSIIANFEKADEYIVVSINGLIIPKQFWETIHLKENDCIVIMPVVGKGEKEKQILNIVIMIAIAYYAPGIIGGLPGATTAAGKLTLLGNIYASGVILAGGVLVNALTPRPKQKSPDFVSSELSQTFGWEPTTMQRQGIPIPRFYGRNKLYGNVIATWTEITGASTNKQYLYSLFSLCMGPIRGLLETPDMSYLKTGTIAVWTFHNSYTDIDDVVVVDLPDENNLMSDNFNDGNTTGWTLINDGGFGTPSFTNPSTYGQLWAGTPFSYPPDEIDEKGAFAKWDAGSAWTDYKITLKFKSTNSLVFSCGIMFRYTDQDNYYRVSFDEHRSRCRLVRRKSGTTILLSEEDYVDVRSAYITLVITCQGSAIIVTINGTQLFLYSDNDLDININNQPATNFNNISYRKQQGLLAQGVTDWFSQTKTELTPNRKIDSAAGFFTYKTPDSDFDSLEIDLAFPLGLYYASGGSLVNYSVNVKIEIKKMSEPEADYLTITRSTETITDNISSKVIRSFDSVRRTITGVTKTNPGVITAVAHGYSNGDLIRIEDVLGMTELNNQEFTITNVTNNTFEIGDTSSYTAYSSGGLAHKDLSQIVEYGNIYNIKITKVTTDKNDALYGDKLYLDRVREVTNNAFVYPRTALLGIRALATDQLSGSIGFSGLFDCLYIRIYDDTTQTWNIKYSANPGWILFDLLTQPVYSGDGTVADPFVVQRYDGVNPSRLDLVKFTELANFCGQEIVNTDTIGIENISKAINAIVKTNTAHEFFVGDEIIFYGVDQSEMPEVADGTKAKITSVLSATKFEIDLDTSGYTSLYDRPIFMAHWEDGAAGYGGPFTDSSDSGGAIIRGVDDAELSSIAKFGNMSILFDNVLDTAYMFQTDSEKIKLLKLLSDDWSVSLFVKHITHTSVDVYCSKYVDSDNYWCLYHYHGNGIRFVSVVASVFVIDTVFGGEISDTSWHHIAVCKVGSNIGVYKDGTQIGYYSMGTGDTWNLGGNFEIGSLRQTSVLNGRIDELRISSQNIFDANPVAGLTDTIVEPAAAFSEFTIATVAKVKHFIEFNGGFDEGTTIWEAALRVCEIARCVMVWNGTIITLAIDKAASPVQMFTVGNIIKDSLNEVFLPQNERASEIEISYCDSKQEYKRSLFTIFNTNIVNITNKITLDLFGITDTYMAENAGDFRLLQNQYLKRIIEFEADIDAIACTVGDVIQVQHDLTDWGEMANLDEPYGGGGRVVSSLVKSCVGHWKMNDNAATTTVIDSSGKNNNGTFSDATGDPNTDAHSVAGKINTAIIFDGVDDYINCGNDVSLDITDAITIAVWVKPGVLQTQWDRVVGKDLSYVFYVRDSYMFSSELYIDGVWRGEAGNISITQDVWNHIVMTYDSVTKIHKHYKDGVLVGQGTLSGLNNYKIAVSSSLLEIGRMGNLPYTGKIDDVRVYNRALNPTDIANIYNNGIGTENLGTSVVVDRKLSFKPAIGGNVVYQLMVRLSHNDSIETKTITAYNPDIDTIIVDSAFTYPPARGDVWAIGRQNLVVKQYRVINLQQTSEQKIIIGAIEYNSAVYAGDP